MEYTIGKSDICSRVNDYRLNSIDLILDTKQIYPRDFHIPMLVFVIIALLFMQLYKFIYIKKTVSIITYKKINALKTK